MELIFLQRSSALGAGVLGKRTSEKAQLLSPRMSANSIFDGGRGGKGRQGQSGIGEQSEDLFWEKYLLASWVSHLSSGAQTGPAHNVAGSLSRQVLE